MLQSDSAVTVSARGLSRRFGGHFAVREVNLSVMRGEVVGFLGLNGAGKTTTMQMLTGNLAPSAGSIEICGIDLLEHPTRAKFRIGYLPETPPLYPELKVDEYLRFVGRLHGLRREGLATAVKQAKQRCGLVENGNRLIGTLSKGFQQRVGIAQAILHDPDLVILDEPTVGLDPNQIREIRSLIRELRGEHSVILSTHLLPEVETLCDRVEIMHEGRVVYADSITEMKRRRDGGDLTVGFQHPPAPEELARVPGVTRVEALSAHQFRVFHEQGSDPSEALLEAAARNAWGLNVLTPGHASLEEVFVRITQGEELESRIEE
jgi:gliding motility-associated transport system ATP-binding protein